MPLWLFLSATYRPRAVAFAGADHALECMAGTLAARQRGGGGGGGGACSWSGASSGGQAGSCGGGGGGGGAHIVFPCTRAAALAAAAQGGYLPALRPSADVAGVAVAAPGPGRPVLHAVLRDGEDDDGAAGADEGHGTGSSSGSSGALPAATLRRMVEEAAAVLRRAHVDAAAASSGGDGEGSSGCSDGGKELEFWVVVDADGAQAAARGDGSGDSNTAPASLLEAAVAAWGRRVLVTVQNVHFLPFGPEGAGPRRPSLLAAWRCAGGAVAPSEFVAACVVDAGVLPRARVAVVPYAAWGAFGVGPFEDVGARVAVRLAVRGARGGGEEGGGAEPPTVLMLKLSP
jgi:hypothetical protein